MTDIETTAWWDHTMSGDAYTASTHRFQTLAHLRSPSLLLVTTMDTGPTDAPSPATEPTKGTADLCPVGWDIHIDNATVRSAWPSHVEVSKNLHATSPSKRGLPDPLEHAGWIGREKTGAQALRHVVVQRNGLAQVLEDGQHMAAGNSSSTEVRRVP